MAFEETIRVRFEADVGQAEAQIRSIEKTVDDATRTIDQSMSRAGAGVAGRRGGGFPAGLARRAGIPSQYGELVGLLAAQQAIRAVDRVAEYLNNAPPAPGGAQDFAAQSATDAIRGVQSGIGLANVSKFVNRNLEFLASQAGDGSFFGLGAISGAARALGFGTGAEEIKALQDQAIAAREARAQSLATSRIRNRETSFNDLGFSVEQSAALSGAGLAAGSATGDQIVEVLRRIERNTSQSPSTGGSSFR